MGRSGQTGDLRAVMRARQLAPLSGRPAAVAAVASEIAESTLPRPVWAINNVQVIPPYVSVSRAVDSDRGEIDVDGDLGEGNRFIDGGRFEREEYDWALELATREAIEHGAFLIDEVAGKVWDTYASAELKEIRLQAIAADDARRAAEEEARRVKRGDEVWVPSGGGPTAIVISVDEDGIATCERRDTGEWFSRPAAKLAKAR